MISVFWYGRPLQEKEENAGHTSNFIFADYVFQKHSFSGTLTHSHTMTPFGAPGKQAFWKHCMKKRNCS